MRRLLTTMALAILLTGCGGSFDNLPVWSDRTTWPQVNTTLYPDYQGPITGETVTVASVYSAYVTVSVRGSTDDPGKYWTRAEVDYGDGMGWQDITDAARYFWKHGGKTPDAYVLKHFTPGTYSIRSRATYFDGEQLVSDPPITIVVTP